MLPTKGYFQDIECPYYNSSCIRPYCHFRHRKKPTETIEDVAEKSSVPTYRPTPKAELANIHNRSHIPISYVPDLAFRSSDRIVRPPPKFDKVTYKPTPLSILSSANKRSSSISDENEEHKETIEDIKQNIANNEYDPSKSEINFEDLNSEFQLIDEIITCDKDEKSDTEKLKTTDSRASNSKEPSREKHVERDKFKEEKSSKTSEKHSSKSSDSSSEKSSRCSKNNSEKSNKSSDKKRKSASTDKEKRARDKTSKKDSSRDKDKHEKSSKSSKSKSEHKKESKSRHSSKHKSRDKEKERKKDTKSKKSTSNKSKTKKKHSSSESSTVEDNLPSPEPQNVSDLEMDDDEEETMRECYKIFNEYKPENPELPKHETPIDKKETCNDGVTSKKRLAHSNADKTTTKHVTAPPKSKPALTPGQILSNRYKQSTRSDHEQEDIAKEIKNMMQDSTTLKRPAPSLLEAARQRKIQRKLQEESKPSVNIIEDIINAKPKTQPKKIAAVPNVALIQKAKARISELTKTASFTVKTVAQTQKSRRVAHVPDHSLSEIPDVLEADKSKLAVNVRTRYLTMIAEECVKLYYSKTDAYQRALNEEFACYGKCKALVTYRNSAMLAVNRLRKEIQEREAKGLGLLDAGEENAKKRDDFSGRTFYDHVKKWTLNEEELHLHGYPKESGERGRALLRITQETDYSIDENHRKCSRCSKRYQVDDDGWPIYDEECIYHPLKKRTIRGEQVYLCCKTTDDSGCATSDTHVSEGLVSQRLEGYQATMPPENDEDDRSYAVYALDCEMCYTTKGLELTRVTIVDTDCKTVYESLVKPLNPIIDYNTRFSGITKEQMDRTSTSILQVQANILHLCNSKTILVGHSLESDMKALKIVHENVIDTSVLFPHKMGLPHKKALRVLASECLKKIIQNDVAGHDSAEDAITCMELVKWKLREELKVRTK